MAVTTTSLFFVLLFVVIVWVSLSGEDEEAVASRFQLSSICDLCQIANGGGLTGRGVIEAGGKVRSQGWQGWKTGQEKVTL